MRHLQKLGVDISKASLAWWRQKDAIFDTEWHLGTIQGTGHGRCHKLPTFTLQDMLEMIKKVFAIHISIYQDEIFLTLQKIEGFVEFEHSSDYLIECAYEALCWCAKNNYIGGNNESK